MQRVSYLKTNTKRLKSIVQVPHARECVDLTRDISGVGVPESSTWPGGVDLAE
jgi:hypothetical protein